ncbi:MAG: S8 family serine peptidase, partial [Myxococcales bacterium]|nr:S8 family serine peptidase [Myxococcales bacterium]
MRTRVLVVWLSVLAGCTPDPASEFETGAPALAVPDEVARRIADEGGARVILTLDDTVLGLLPGPRATPEERAEIFAERARDWVEIVQDVIDALPPEVSVARSWEHLPLLAIDVDDLAIAESLLRLPLVTAMSPEEIYTTELSQSLALIGQPTAASQGFLGAGTSVAVLDTGADWTHPDLGSCTAVNTPASCRVAYAADFAPNDGARDANGHGTNVSAIVAAVAPGTDILALDVFNGGGASSTDILSALDWVIANQATYHIAAVNMSLGGGLYASPCADVFATGIANTRAAGVSVVVASGNDARPNAMSSPACNAGALSVGAVYDSNMGPISWSG